MAERMTIEFEYDPLHQIILCRLQGSVTDSSIKEYYRAAGKCAAATSHKAAILDLSGVTSFNVSSGILRELAYSEPVIPDPSRMRFVVAPAAHVFGVARMFQAMGEEKRPLLRVVSTMVEVYKTLGVPESPFEPIDDPTWRN